MPATREVLNHSGFENEEDCCAVCGVIATHNEKGKMLCLDCYWKIRADKLDQSKGVTQNGPPN